MRDQNSNPGETTPTWDAGTYQTGPSAPPKRQSVLTTALLMGVIFLGGLASFLGVMNVRLWSRLMAQEGAKLDVATNAGSSFNSFRNNSISDFQVPLGTLNMRFTSAASRELSKQQLLSGSDACTVTLIVDDGERTYTALGLVVDSSGYIVTNARSVDGSEQISLSLSDGESCNAMLIASDVYADLAVLYVTKQLPAAEFSAVPDPDQPIYVRTEDALHSGTLCRETTSDRFQIDWISTDLTDFVGPVFNAYGQVVGFQCRSVDESTGSALLSSRQMEQILNDLVSSGSVSGHPILRFRVRTLSVFCRQYWGLSDGLQVTDVTAEGIADGLQDGDILLSIDGEALTGVSQLYAAIAAHLDGSTLALEVFRAGQRFTLDIRVSYDPS